MKLVETCTLGSVCLQSTTIVCTIYKSAYHVLVSHSLPCALFISEQKEGFQEEFRWFVLLRYRSDHSTLE